MGQNSHIRLAENIALLTLLGEVPRGPLRRAPPHRVADQSDKGRCLPLWAERILVRMLAFLSGIKDDPSKVTAVCVHETDEGEALSVMVAANSRGWVLLSPYLDSIKRGLDELFLILANASRVHRGELEEQVTRVCTSMCHDRIVSRTRFDTPKKPSLQKLLREILDGFATLPRRRRPAAFRVNVENLVAQLDRGQALFGTSKGLRTEQLLSVVKAFESLRQMPDFETILLQNLDSVIPPIQRNMRQAIFDTTRKMCHYTKVATKLVKMAKRYRVLRHASVEITMLDNAAYSRDQGPAGGSLAQVLERITSKTHSLSALCWNLRKNRNVQRLAADFSTNLKRSACEAGVHAEVQLLSRLEQYACVNKPRVIASNKDACFLCDALIVSHGLFLVPGSHGRVYPLWRMPSTCAKPVVDKFNVELERLLAQRIRTLSSGPLLKYEHPTESTVSSRMETITTLMTGLSHEGSSDDDDTVTGDTTPLATQILASHSHDGGPEGSRDEDGAKDVDSSQLADDMKTMGLEQGGVADQGKEVGEAPYEEPWRRVTAGHMVRGFGLDKFDMYVEYQAPAANSTRESLSFRQRLVSPQEVSQGCEHPVYDLDEIGPQEQVVPWCRDCNMIRLKAGGQVTAIELSPY